MAFTNPFEQFQIKPTSFKTKTTNPALNALGSPAATQPAVKTSTRPVAPMQKLGTTIDTGEMDSFDANVKKTSSAVQTSTGTGTGTNTSMPQGQANQPGTQSPPPAGGDTSGNAAPPDPFDYSNYTQSGRLSDTEIGMMDANTRNDYRTLNDTIAQLQSVWEQKRGTPFEEAAKKELDRVTALRDQMESDFRTNHAGDAYLNTLTDLIANWNTSYTDDTTVQPFESEWTAIFGDAFGNLSDLGSSTDFLQGFMNNFGLDEIITGQVNWGDYGFENYTPEALMKFLEDGSNIPGFEWKEGDPNVSSEQEFIKFIMNEAKTIRDKVGSFDWTQIFGEVGPEMGERMKAALNLINSPGITAQERDAIIKRNMATVIKDAEAQKREYDLLTGTQLAGQSTKSAHYRRLVDRDVMMARAQVEGDLTELDLQLRQENYKTGLAELGSISRDKMGAMIDSMEIAGTREGQVLNFLSQVGEIAVGSKDTEYKHYENRLKAAQDFYLQNSDRILREQLGKAGIQVDVFNIKTNEGLEQMRTAYETALKNRGMNIDEAKANADQLLETYKIGQSFAQMDINKLTTLAELAAKAQDGDRQAWGAYNSMMLEERLKNRGMDIDEAQSIAQLAYGMWTTEKQTALTMWVEKYRGQLEREMAQFQADNQPSPWLSAVGDLFGGIGQILPFLIKPGTNTDTGTSYGDYNTSTEGFA